MYALIQYLKLDNSWSNWTASTFDNGHFMVDGQALDNTTVRVLKDNNPENPHVAWYIIHEHHLYEATKSKTGFINKATPVDNKTLTPISIEKCVGDFSLKAFDDMLQSAIDELAPPLFTLTDIQERIMRPADTAHTMNLMQAETSAQRIQNWWKDLYEHYRQDVEQQLTLILTQPLKRNQQIEALQEFLKSHHAFIQGTCLDYLAIPNHPVTQTLSHIAELLAQNTGIPAIQLLMPGVAMESVKDDYVNLSDISLSDILQSHIELTPQYLMPVRCLNEYIQNPHEILYSPYCDDFMPKQATPEDVQALFNHSQTTQQLRDAFQTYQGLLHNQDNLLGQLHILGFKLKRNDAHGGKGSLSDAAMGAYPAIMDFMNYYTSLEPCSLQMKETPPKLANLPQGQHIGYAFYQNQLYFLNGYENQITTITNPEHPAKFSVHLARFGNLADVPQDIALPAIVKTDNEEFTFFPGQITLDSSIVRCMDINFPNEYHRVINLSESNIPKTVFDAIAKTGFEAPNFAELFHQRFPQSKNLSSDDLAFIDIHTEHSFMSGYSRVPQALRNEIEILWQLLHNPAKNIEATQNIATCIGTRGEEIRSLSRRYEAELCQIGMHPEKQLQLLQDAQRVLDMQLEEFKGKSHPGCDTHLCLSHPILDRYRQTILIESLADCHLLSGFQPKDLKVLLDNNPIIIYQLIDQLHQRHQRDGYANFVVYLSETPIRTLEVILPHTTKLLIAIMFQFQQISDLLGIEKSEFIISQLPRLIHDVEDFYNVIRHVSPEQSKKIYDAFKGQWSSIIQNLHDFSKVMQVSYPEQRAEVLDALKDVLTTLIKNVHDFNHVIINLPPVQRQQVFELLKSDWPNLIKNSNDFSVFMRNLSAAQRTEVFDAFKADLPTKIRDVKDFNDVIVSLSSAQRMHVIAALNDQWPRIILNAREFSSLMFHLTREQLEAVYDACKACLPRIIHHAHDFADVMQALYPEKKSEIFEAFKAILPSMIQNGGNFCVVMKVLSNSQQTEMYDALQYRWSTIIKSATDFSNIMSVLSHDKYTEVYDALLDCLPSIIQNVNDFLTIMSHLSADQGTQVLVAIKADLPRIIKNQMNFKACLYSLTSEQISLIIDSLTGKWSSLFQTEKDFHSFHSNLSENQRASIENELQEKWKGFMGLQVDYINHWNNVFLSNCRIPILSFMTTEQRTLLIDKSPLSKIGYIAVWTNSQKLATYFSPEQYAYLYDVGEKTTMDFILDIRKKLEDADHISHIQFIKNNPIITKPRDNEAPFFVENIFKLSEGIDALLTYCSEEAVECFLSALFSQDADAICCAFENLQHSKVNSPEHSLFASEKGNPNAVLAIVNEKFPRFCSRMIAEQKTKTQAVYP